MYCILRILELRDLFYYNSNEIQRYNIHQRYTIVSYTHTHMQRHCYIKITVQIQHAVYWPGVGE